MTILRVACYERVSTLEQSKYGYSVRAQIENLTEYCEQNKYKLVGHYTDEGVSGAKPPLQRPGLQRLLDDVKAGKIDLIIFTKLDRWFRSVKEYHKVQEILDRHGVQWKTIHEEYNTATADGVLKINLYLAIAQNERDKGAERVKFVLNNKRKNKEACFGGPFKPMGYKKERDEDGVLRLVKDPETEEMTAEFWRILVKHNNLSKAIRYMAEVHGVTKSPKTWTRIARSPFYCGMWDDIEDFCEPYVSMEDWLMIQETAERRRQDTRAKRVYLFSGMVRCPECGHILCGTYKTDKKNGRTYEYLSYRCRFKWTVCGYKHSPTERKIEKYLLKNLRDLLADEIAVAELERTKPKKKPKTNIPALKERLRRLEVVYLAGNKPDDEYLAEQREIKDLIAKAEADAPPPERDLEPLREILSTDFETIYATLDREEKRLFWRGLIKEIVFTDRDITDVIFF